MDHLVRFSTAGGRAGQHTADSLNEALQFVERLRNNEDVSDVHVFRMQEVPISFRTYYKVEVSADGDDAEGVGDDGRGPGQASASAGVGVPGAAPGNGQGVAGGEGPGEGGGRRLFSR